MYKLSNVDLIITMQQIVDATVEGYKTDFEYDVVTLETRDRCKGIEKEDFHYLWITRQNGTHLAPEITLFHRDSYAQLVYKENEKRGNFFIIDITDPVKITGNITAIRGIHGNFKEEDYPVYSCDVVFNSGHKESYTVDHFDGYKQRLISCYGSVDKITYRVSPEDQYPLDLHLKRLRQQRDRQKECSLDMFFNSLKTDYERYDRYDRHSRAGSR